MRLLVTGGAGYIGGHFVARALDRGLSDIVIVDDLSTGLLRRVPATLPFYDFDLAQDSAADRLVHVFKQHTIDAVVHFAAQKVVEDSVAYPEEYFRKNIGATTNVLSAMREANVLKMIFSSSAAVYGEPKSPVVYEDTPCLPINPYGQSKLISELSLANATRAWGMRAISLRYFNVAGAQNSLLADTTTTNLMPAIRDRITRGQGVSIFGNDYATPDGTCVRDYIHILDLVDAHLVALRTLLTDAEPGHHMYNVGTGRGSSVLEIVEAFRALPDVELDYDYGGRRPGDPGALTANVDKMARELSWTAQFGTQEIVKSVVDFPPLSEEDDLE